MKLTRKIFLAGIFALTTPVNIFSQWANLNNIYPFSWKDGPESIKDRFAYSTGEATKSAQLIDETTSSDQSTGVVSVLEIPVTFAYYPAVFSAGFEAGNLSALNFKIEYKGNRDNARKILSDVYLFLKDLYGPPQNVNILSGEKIWKNQDGNQSLHLKIVMTDMGQDSEKNLSKVYGEAKISGLTRRLYSKNEEYETESVLDAGTEKSNTLTIVSEKPYEKVDAHIYVNFINQKLASEEKVEDAGTEDAEPEITN